MESPFRGFGLQLERVYSETDATYRELTHAHSVWTKNYDARLSTLSGILNVYRASRIALVTLGHQLSDPQWWSVHRGGPPGKKELTFDYVAYSQFSKNGHLHFCFGVLENGIRLILRALDPNVAAGATAEFKGVYDCLFKTKLALEDSHVNAFDVARLLRNTIHNEGVHFPRRGASHSLTWRGQAYEFRVGEPIDFMTWPFIIDLVDDLTQTFLVVVNHNAVRRHADTIEDPGVMPYEQFGAGEA